MRFIGRFERELSPVNLAEIPWPARSPASRRTLVPEFSQFKTVFGVTNEPPDI